MKEEKKALSDGELSAVTGGGVHGTEPTPGYRPAYWRCPICGWNNKGETFTDRFGQVKYEVSWVNDASTLELMQDGHLIAHPGCPGKLEYVPEEKI